MKSKEEREGYIWVVRGDGVVGWSTFLNSLLRPVLAKENITISIYEKVQRHESKTPTATTWQEYFRIFYRQKQKHYVSQHGGEKQL